jgi:hypothetical protein
LFVTGEVPSELCGSLGMLALTAISILVVGMVLLMYPTALSNDLIVSRSTKRKIFFGFGALSVRRVGYLLDRQIVIRQLRQGLAGVLSGSPAPPLVHRTNSSL